MPVASIVLGVIGLLQNHRVLESVIPALAYGNSCRSSVELRNLSDRVVEVEIEGHHDSGALVPLTGHGRNSARLRSGERVHIRLEIEDQTNSAWMRVREKIPEGLPPAIAVSGSTDCSVENQLYTVSRQAGFAIRNPWFSGETASMQGAAILMVNSSEHLAKASVCYSTGNTFAVPEGNAPARERPVCSYEIEVQVAPFGTRQFQVEREGSSYFSVHTEGEAILLQMMRPVHTGVKVFQVDSAIRFESDVPPDGRN